METVLSRVVRVLNIQTGKPADELSADTQLADLGFDSLDVVECSVMLEDHFGVKFDDEKMADFKTVGQIAEYAEGLING